MIVKMSKIYVAAAASQRENCLNALRKLGVLHIVPVDPERAEPDPKLATELSNFEKAVLLLENIEPSGNAPEISFSQAAAETCEIHRRSQELNNRLSNLYRQHEQAELWGDLNFDDIDTLTEQGIKADFYIVPAIDAEQIQAQCVSVLHELPGKKVLVATAGSDEPVLPESAELLEKPKQDRPTLRKLAKEVDEKLAADTKRLADLSSLRPELLKQLTAIHGKTEFMIAANGAHCDQTIFAVQGWAPTQHVDDIAPQLETQGIVAAVHKMAPPEDETPPTLLRHAKWVKPIVALFDILGTVPGYREMDISPFFMLAMPIFTAMLVGDAGYGLIFTLVGLLFYKKLNKLTGKSAAGQLITIFGICTIAWGVLTANYFGVTPADMAKAGNFVVESGGKEVMDYAAMAKGTNAWAAIGNAMLAPAKLWNKDPEVARNIVMKISFLLAVIHLVLAHLRKALYYFPSQQFLAETGWAIFMVGMFEVVWLMFFHAPPFGNTNIMLGILGAGLTLIFLFSHPVKNPFKRVGMGVLGNLMSIVSAFGDTLSYIRLMAVGLASYYMASAFNGLATMITDASIWWLPASILILLLAHSLNLFLCIIAIFAHGVRLNLLEFSNNSGVEWSGHPFTPFSETPNVEGDQ